MISKYSVKRPYTVLVAVVLVIVLGVVSLSKMTTDLLPDMSFQYALVITTDMGASPEQVESDVTAPIESAMATTSNIKNISSISYNSYSIVTLEYEQNANMDSVVIEIQQSLDQISGQWDDSIGTPMIMKVNPDMLPVLAAAVDVDGMDAAKLSEYVENELSPAIESLEGVASVTTTGQLEESVQVTLNQDKIDALNKKVQKSIDKQFAKSQKEIDANKKKVEDGQSSINTGSDQLTDAINQTMDKQQELLKTEKDLKNQLADLKKQQKSVTDSIRHSDFYAVRCIYGNCLCAQGQSAACRKRRDESTDQAAEQSSERTVRGIVFAWNYCKYIRRSSGCFRRSRQASDTGKYRN